MQKLIVLAILAAFSSTLQTQSAEADSANAGGEYLTLDESWALPASQYPGFAGYFQGSL